MNPTFRLRFVDRVHPYKAHQTIRVLQQWWQFDELFDGAVIGSWEDVPLEEEE